MKVQQQFDRRWSAYQRQRDTLWAAYDQACRVSKDAYRQYTADPTPEHRTAAFTAMRAMDAAYVAWDACRYQEGELTK